MQCRLDQSLRLRVEPLKTDRTAIFERLVVKCVLFDGRHSRKIALKLTLINKKTGQKIVTGLGKLAIFDRRRGWSR